MPARKPKPVTLNIIVPAKVEVQAINRGAATGDMDIAERGHRLAENFAAKAGMDAGHDGEPPEFREARDIEGRDSLTGKIVRIVPAGPQNINCDRIEWLFAHHKIGKRQYEAANTLMSDHYLSGRETIAVAGTSSGGNREFEPAEQREFAGRRLKATQEHFTRGWKSTLWPILNLVVLRNVSPGKAAGIERTHERTVQERLSIGLHLLADYYGREDS